MPFQVEKLRESLEFLSSLIDNITSAVFLVDDQVRVRQFNESFEKIFDAQERAVLGELCGNALGCAFTVDEDKPCGETSNCDKCQLRKDLLAAMTESVPADKRRLDREFYVGGQAVMKHLLVTTRSIDHQGETLVMVIVDDVTLIESQRRELVEKQRLLDQDLESAALIQKALLPKASQCCGKVRFSWSFEPCDAVGGDLPGIVPLGPDMVGAYVLDVAGHGVPGAMLTVSVANSMTPLAALTGGGQEVRTPAEVFEYLCREYPYDRFNRHFTMAYALVDAKTGRMTYSRAAHPCPFLLKSDGSTMRLEEGGSIIGIGGVEFEQGEILLKPGDKVIMYSDGLIEYPDPPGHMIREQGLAEILDAHRTQPIERMLEMVVADLKQIGQGKPPGDDMTLLGFEISA